MKHELRGLSVALVCACTTLSGCELMHHEQRPKQPVETIHEEAEDPSSVDAVSSKPTKGFFAPTRLSGAWSSEARSIERNLGVGN